MAKNKEELIQQIHKNISKEYRAFVIDLIQPDGGKFLFFIHQDDLKKRDFSKVVATLDTA